MLNVVFRTDASLSIGTGHVMRCLTLADTLREKGAKCQFICREQTGNLIRYINDKGYLVNVLPATDGNTIGKINDPTAHSHLLNCNQTQDAQNCQSILKTMHVDWLIVDHYSLDNRWEESIRHEVAQIMVIDDLADRAHDCDILLDQNLGRTEADYEGLLPQTSQKLIGPKFALLRPQFAQLRAYSLQRREQPQLKNLLITMGGIDKDNVTGQILQSIQNTKLPTHCRITVVMGAHSPWIEEVQKQILKMPLDTTLRINVDNMAELMADCDLAIGAAGTTSWERCCLGLPCTMVVLAQNQNLIARGLVNAGAASVLTLPKKNSLSSLFDSALLDPKSLAQMSQCAATITDGQGTKHLLNHLH